MNKRQYNKWTFLALLLLLGVLVSIGVVVAQEGFITACINGENGNTRIVTSSADCREPEYSIQWSISGPSGLPGPAGPPGPAGQDGAAGPQGMPGFSTLFNVTAESTGVNCAYGGQKVEGGLDNGDNGGVAYNNVLDMGEIDFVQFVCNGVPGMNGLPGTMGLACWDTDGSGGFTLGEDTNLDGILDAKDCQGQPGSLVLTGQSCPTGQFITGFDTNSVPVCAAPSVFAPFEGCDNQDNDLNGLIDEELPYCFNGVPAPNTNGKICMTGYSELNAVLEDGCEKDTDGDLHFDNADNCPNRFNFFQNDGDGDNIGDVCDSESGSYSGLWVLDQPITISCNSNGIATLPLSDFLESAIQDQLQEIETAIFNEFGIIVDFQFSGNEYVFDSLMFEQTDPTLWLSDGWVTHFGEVALPIPVNLSSSTMFSNSIGVTGYEIEMPPPFSYLGSTTIDASVAISGEFTTPDMLALTYTLSFEINGSLSSFEDEVCQDGTWHATATRQ